MQEAQASHAVTDRPQGLRGTAPFILSGLSGGHGIFHWFTQSFFVMLPAVVATFGLSGFQVGAIFHHPGGSVWHHCPSGRRGNGYAAAALGHRHGRMYGLVRGRLAGNGAGSGISSPVGGHGHRGHGGLGMASSRYRGLVPSFLAPPGLGPVLPRNRREHRRRAWPGADWRTALRRASCHVDVERDPERLHRRTYTAQFPGLLGVS